MDASAVFTPSPMQVICHDVAYNQNKNFISGVEDSLISWFVIILFLSLLGVASLLFIMLYDSS